jgi:hypothetical protein
METRATELPGYPDTSAKVLDTMKKINEHFVGLYNEATGKINFLGKKQIADNPALFDGHVDRGETVCCFFHMTKDADLTPDGNVGFTCHITCVAGFDMDHVKEYVRAYHEMTFGFIPTLKN